MKEFQIDILKKARYYIRISRYSYDKPKNRSSLSRFCRCNPFEDTKSPETKRGALRLRADRGSSHWAIEGFKTPCLPQKSWAGSRSQGRPLELLFTDQNQRRFSQTVDCLFG